MPVGALARPSPRRGSAASISAPQRGQRHALHASDATPLRSGDTRAVTRRTGHARSGPVPTSTRPRRAGVRPPRRRATTPRSRASRTPWRRSGTRSASATATSRPTSTPPATACCWPSTTASSTGSPTAPAAIADTPYAEVQARADRRPRARADAGRALRRVPRRPLQHRHQVRTAPSTALADFIAARGAWDRVLVGSFSARRMRPSVGAPRAGSPTSAHPLRGRRVRPLPQRPARPAGSPGADRRRSRSRTAAAGCRGRRPGWSGGRTPPASTCTCGPSTTRPRCTSCSTLASTDS